MTAWVEYTLGISALIFTVISIVVAWTNYVRQQKKDFNDSLNRLSSSVYKEWSRLTMDMGKTTFNHQYLPSLVNKVWACTIACLPIVKFRITKDGAWEFTKVHYFKIFSKHKKQKNKKLAELFTQFDKALSVLLDPKIKFKIHDESSNELITEFCLMFARIANQQENEITLDEVKTFSKDVISKINPPEDT